MNIPPSFLRAATRAGAACALLLLVLWFAGSLRTSSVGSSARPSTAKPTPAGTAQNAPTKSSPPPSSAGALAAPAPAEISDRAAVAAGSHVAFDPAVFVRFEGWIERYLQAAPEERAALLAEGRELAAARRRQLAALIPREPQRALQLALPMTLRQQLPREIESLLEERVSARGFLGVVGVVGAPAEAAPIRRQVRTETGARYDAYVFGRRSSQPTTARIYVSGIAVDRALALDERPFRVLEAGEVPTTAQAAVETCAISGLSTAVTRTADNRLPAIAADTPAVEVAGTIHYLCSGGHIRVFEEKLVANEGATGGGLAPVNPVPGSVGTGVKTILFIRAAFPESRQELLSEAAAYTMLRDTNDWFANASFGQVYLVPMVTPLILLPHPEAWYTSSEADDYNLRDDAIAVARAQGFDVDAYDLDVVAWANGPGGYAGAAYVGERGLWLKHPSYGVLCHELGHNFGVWHANFWSPTGASPIGWGIHAEYGNPFDTMGPASAGDLHFNAQFKSTLEWMPRGTFVHRASSSGTYRIHAFDQPTLNAANRYALTIPKDEREYWVEFRQLPHGGNPWINQGVLVNWAPWSLSAAGTHLLDMAPGSPDYANDSALLIGRTFSDFESGIHVTPIGKGGTTPQSMDVVVNLGAFPGNSAPVLSSLAASATAVAVNVAVNFTATASDANGDALSYAWDFGDKTFGLTNAATQSKSWSAAGDYAVRCVVSDMKGGTSSRTVVVRVGSPSTFRLTGTVLNGGLPVANARIHNGQVGVNYRTAFTDSDGTYTLVNVPTGNITLSGAHEAFTLTPNGFSNPVNVTGNVSGANFAAAAIPVVTLTATDPDAIEGSANSGQFTFTRTGSTAAAMSVYLALPAGSATFTSDYEFSPALLGGTPYEIQIPAGASSFNLVVNPTNDTSAEGPETVALALLGGVTYRTGAAAVATVTIDDNDTALPRVTLAAAANVGREGASTPSFRLRRTGSTAAALNVALTFTGTATAGVDYVSPGSPLTIPAGASELLVPVTLLDDTLAEDGETLTILVAGSAAYVRSLEPSEFSTTLELIDDDTPVISVFVSDNVATEGGGDHAQFTIVRTGSLALPRTVNYALGGSALPNTDYLPVAGLLVIPAGASQGTVTIIPVDDGIGEPAETVVLQIRGGSGYVTDGTSVGTVNILNDTDLPVVTVGVSAGAPSEPATPGTFVITARSNLPGTMTVKYTITGTAMPGADYVALPGTVTMNRHGTTTIAVTPLDDAAPENLENLTLILTPDPAYQLFHDTSATLFLGDDDQNIVSVTTQASTPAEFGPGGAGFFLSRSGSTATPLLVNFLMGGSATNGVDYGLVATTATLAAGQSGTVVPINPVNDALVEGTETITLTLAPGAYGIGFPSASLNLTDNEVFATKVSFGTAAATSSETVGTVSIPVTLSAPAGAAGVRVEYVIDGGSALPNIDYQFTSGALFFAAGETGKTLALTVLDDVYREPGQTVVLKLQHATGASLGANNLYTHTIIDDDTQGVTIAATTPVTGEFGAAPGVFTLTRTGSTLSALDVKVGFSGTAVNGTDYALLGTTWTIAAGQSSLTVPVTPLIDTVIEGGENVQAAVLLESGYNLGGATSATVTIADRPMDVWRLARFGAQAGTPAIGGDLADPDSDGLNNVLEYLTGGDPLNFTPAPAIAIEGGDLTLTYSRALAAVDVARAIETAPSPSGSWGSAAATEEILSDNGTVQVIKARIPLDAGPAKFVRLRASKL